MGFTLLAPSDPKEVMHLLSASPPGDVALLAGGTDLLLDLDEGRAAPKSVVSLRSLPWKTLDWQGDGLVIGSTLPLSEVERDARVRKTLPGLWKAIHAVGSVALRHRATIGGNLGRSAPASDLIPVLLTLDARVLLVGPDGSREVLLDEFVVGSRSIVLRRGELIRAVLVPEGRPSEYLWQRVRPANDISQVGVAVALAAKRSAWRLALGGVFPRPTRIREAEAMLHSTAPTEEEVTRAAEEAALRAPFVSDKRATEPYRRRLVRTLVGRAVREVATQALSRGGDYR